LYITVRYKAFDEKSVLFRTAKHLALAYIGDEPRYGQKSVYSDEIFADLYYNSILLVSPIAGPYSRYSIKMDIPDVDITIRVKGKSPERAPENAAVCLRDCFYDTLAFEYCEDECGITEEPVIKEFELVPTEYEDLYFNVIALAKI
jgi:hypothetical protein